MIYTKKTKFAMAIAYVAHSDQVDKSELPYIIHPIIVAEHMDDEKSTIVALLHDIVEDGETSLDDLRCYGFDEEIVEAIDAITRRHDESYNEYIRRVGKNEIARKVKLEDLKHNMDLGRLDDVSDEDEKRVYKYKKAYEKLLKMKDKI